MYLLRIPSHVCSYLYAHFSILFLTKCITDDETNNKIRYPQVENYG